MPNNPFALYLTLGAAVIGFTAGWVVCDWKHGAAQTAVITKTVAAKDNAVAVVNTEAASYEEGRAELTNTATIERNTIREYYRNVEVPADCAVSPDARRLLEAAVARANAAASGELGAGLPAAAASSAAAD